jgi:hypothetical protein
MILPPLVLPASVNEFYQRIQLDLITNSPLEAKSGNTLQLPLLPLLSLLLPLTKITKFKMLFSLSTSGQAFNGSRTRERLQWPDRPSGSFVNSSLTFPVAGSTKSWRQW